MRQSHYFRKALFGSFSPKKGQTFLAYFLKYVPRISLLFRKKISQKSTFKNSGIASYGKKTIFFLVFFLSIALQGFSENCQKEIRYSISFKEISNNKLIVNCEFQGNENGETELILPHQFAGQSELYKNIEGLICAKHKMKDTDQPHVKHIIHGPEEKLSISYKIKLLSDGNCPQYYYRPIGDHTFFYAVGHGVFVIPTRENSKMDIHLEWKDLPQGWKIANSFGANQISQKLKRSFPELQSAAFMGGDFQITKWDQGSNPVYLAIRGKYPFSTEEFKSVIEKIIASQRDFWNDCEFPFYLVSVIPIDTKNMTGGTGLTDTFSLFLGDNWFTKEQYLKHLAWLVSHEHFHTWNGHKMSSSEPDGTMYWFSEGFTEYYAIKLNYKYGIITKEEYINHLNEILAEYYLSPVHNAPNRKIAKEFWTHPDIERLPYTRGFTLALYLDAKIQSQQKTMSLDHFMHDLLSFTKQNYYAYSCDDLFLYLGKYLHQDEISEVKEFIFEGKSIPVPEIEPLTQSTLGWEDYLGFNLDKSLSEGIIRGVKRRSIPFQAGLKNGSKLLEFHQGGTVITLSIIDRDEAIEKTVSYDLIEIRKAPQYK